MTGFDSEIAATISGDEHSPGYARENAYAFVSMAEGVAETYDLDLDELRIEHNEYRGHFFVVKEDGDLEMYPVSNSGSDVDYDAPQEEKNWKRSMDLDQFNESLEKITGDEDMELHGLSRGRNYRRKSSTPPGMEGFGGPREVPTEYEDARMYISDKEKDVRFLFKGTSNSGASIKPSLTEKGLAKAKAILSGRSEHDILIESNQSGKESYASITPVQENKVTDGMSSIGNEEIQEIVSNIDEFDVEIK